MNAVGPVVLVTNNGIEMRYRPASTLEELPKVTLRHWRVVSVTTAMNPAPQRHFIGYNEEEQGGQISGPIVKFNRLLMTGRSRSGRVYNLVGPAGTCYEAEQVWQEWCRRNFVATVVAVEP